MENFLISENQLDEIGNQIAKTDSILTRRQKNVSLMLSLPKIFLFLLCFWERQLL